MAQVPYITADEAREALEAAELDVERYLELEPAETFNDLDFGLIQQARDAARARYAAVMSQQPKRRAFAARV